MSYLVLDALFGAVALVIVLAALVTVRKRAPAGGTVPETVSGTLTAVGTTAVVLVILTAVFDNVMIGVGLFDYAGAALLGVRVGLAPLEDFAYPLGAALLLPGLWILMPGRRREGAR